MIPFSCAVFFLIFLTVYAFFAGGSGVEKGSLLTLSLLSSAVLVELVFRRIVTDGEKITIRKFFRSKELVWDNITMVGGLALKHRVYLLLTTLKGFFIISNNYERFTQLVFQIRGHVPSDRVEQQVVEQMENPRWHPWPVIAAWGAVIVIGLIIYLRVTVF